MGNHKHRLATMLLLTKKSCLFTNEEKMGGQQKRLRGYTKKQKARSQWETNILPDRSVIKFGVVKGLTKQIYHHKAILLAGEVL